MSLISGVVSRHTVGNVQVADDVHRDINDLLVRLADKWQGADTAITIAGLQIDQIAGAEFLLWIVKYVQALVKDASR